jgi:hypothetical protein
VTVAEAVTVTVTVTVTVAVAVAVAVADAGAATDADAETVAENSNGGRACAGPPRVLPDDPAALLISGRAGHVEQLLELHGQHRVARDAELALEVELHAGVGVGEHLLEVVVGELDRALGLAAVAADAGRGLGGEIDGPLTATLAGDLERVDGADFAGLLGELLESRGDEDVEELLSVLG